MLDQKAGGYDSRYMYTGKETDEDTGLNYHGARYYDPRISMWHGVDPLIDDYPAWSPFNYVMGNPIRNIDPDGMRVEDDYFTKNGVFIGSDNKGNGIRVVDDVHVEGVKKDLAVVNDGVSSSEIKNESLNRARNFSNNVVDAPYLSKSAENAVIMHYAKSLGFTKNDFVNTNFEEASDGSLASCGYENRLFNLKVKHGIGNQLNNSDDIISMLVHEVQGHGMDWRNGVNRDRSSSENWWQWERRATRKQVYHSSWAGTSKIFRNIIWDAYGKENYVLSNKEQKRFFPWQLQNKDKLR